jgi:hypothetical protein
MGASALVLAVVIGIEKGSQNSRNPTIRDLDEGLEKVKRAQF